jgi:hypothetical protein
MRDIILFIQKVDADTVASIQAYSKKQGTPYRIAVLYDETKNRRPKIIDGIDIVLYCNFSRPESIEKALHPYDGQIAAATCRLESYIPQFSKVIPFIPYVRTPNAESLLWAVDKVMMRKKFRSYDKSITPKFMVIHDDKKETLKKVHEKVGYPLVIKPAGLAQSLLVSICYHEEEFEKTLRQTMKKIKKIYLAQNRTQTPQVLVEEFIDGDMYSVDAYVSSRGTVTCCPPCFIKTGRSIGFDDFFGYIQMTPSKLKKESVLAAEEVVRKSVHALKLRSTTVHVELLRNEDGWKVIEVGPRVGGFRVHLYKHVYGFDHALNDVLTRLPKKVQVNKKVNGAAAAMKIFAKKEGIITKVKGIKKIQQLESIVSLTQELKVGDRTKYAKNGGMCVVRVLLFNKDRSRLWADIRRIEQTLDIQTK